MKRSLLTIALFSFFFHSIHGQDQKLIYGKFENQMFSEMVSSLSSNYDLSFYYEPELDSSLISISFDQATIDELVNELTTSTQLNFIADGDKIICTSGYKIQNSLGDQFFIELSQNESKDSLAQESILESIREVTAAQSTTSTSEKPIEIGDVVKRFDGKSATLSGHVRESKTGEPIIGASVFIKIPEMRGAITDQFGYFNLSLPKGDNELYINSTGMRQTSRQLIVYSDGQLTIELNEDIISLEEIVVTSDRNTIDNIQTGFATINMKSIKQIPSIMGEADIMKIALTLPGVQTVGEGAGGFNVRGGSADQNLVMINSVPVYNTNHLFGFFSVFNPDVIASADLYKSGIGANYGGRIASVFDVTLRDGNKKKFSVMGGISPVTAKVTVEGPIKKDTTSYLIGLRSTYSDYILSLLNDPALQNSTGGFYDGVAKITHQINSDNQIMVSGYHSQDRFQFNSDSLYQYANSNANIQWRNKISSKLAATYGLSYANYNFQLSSDNNPTSAFSLDYHINHYAFNTEFHYFPKEKVQWKFGLSSIFYELQPGSRKPIDDSLIEPLELDVEKGLESALFASYEFEINHRWSASAGLRLSMFNALGPKNVYSYSPNNPKEIEFITDTTSYNNNSLINTYVGPELRLASRFKIREDLSLKVSYDRMYQYIHMLSNSVSISPTDVWRLSGPDIKPQIGNQFSAGLYKNFLGTSLELSIEGYYKRTNNILEYKDGANLQLNEVLETDIIPANGKAYGLEFLLKKQSGKFTGWLSYTYSRSFVQANGEYPEERINSGEYYPSNFDKPHSVTLVTNFKINRRINISLNAYYSTGRPSTFPVVRYDYRDLSLLLYTDRNQYRIPDYFRTDIAINLEGNHKVHKKIHGSWSFSVYNLTSRNNAYSVFYRSEQDQIYGYKLMIFKNAIPTITYHFKLQ